MSLFIVATASAVDDDAGRDATKEGVWTDAIKPDASYFDPKAVAKLGADDSEVLALCLAALLRHHGAHLTRAKSEVEAQRALGLLLLHPASSVRVAAREGVAASIENGRDSAGLLDALRHWMAAAETPGGFPALSVTDGGGGDVTSCSRIAAVASSRASAPRILAGRDPTTSCRTYPVLCAQTLLHARDSRDSRDSRASRDAHDHTLLRHRKLDHLVLRGRLREAQQLPH